MWYPSDVCRDSESGCASNDFEEGDDVKLEGLLKRKAKGDIGYDSLFKVNFSLETMMNGMRKAWVAGKHVTIDESMIQYMGRAISYVQYMLSSCPSS